MMYAPHTLYVKRRREMLPDALGRLVAAPGAEEWVPAGPCRCDDSGLRDVVSANGEVFRPSFRIVLDKGADVRAGDAVRAVNADGSARGEGVVVNVTSTNCLGYMTVYV